MQRSFTTHDITSHTGIASLRSVRNRTLLQQQQQQQQQQEQLDVKK
jgi:hypothetical protein